MEAALNKLLDDIKADYRTFGKDSEIRRKMIEEFDEGIRYETGRKYIKIVTASGSQSSVWGFVVNTDNDKKFRKGDILKAAGWAAPARNFSRGNILDGGYTIRWTGTQ